MSNRSSIAVRSGALLAAALLGAVVAYTVADARATGSPTPTASSSAAATGAGKGGRAKAANGAIARIGARTLHGEFVTGGGKNGAATVTLLQRGTLTAASAASISVRSTDGFTATYPVAAQTKIRKDGAEAAADALATGDSVVVLATRTAGTVTATSITIRTKQPGAAGNGKKKRNKQRQQQNAATPSPTA